MALPTKDILGILVDNLKKRESVLPLSRRKSTGWAEGLHIPKGGDTVMYTGLMYQLMPSIIALEKMTTRVENSWVRHFVGVGRIINKAMNVSALMTLWNQHEQQYFNGLIRNISCLLDHAHIEYGYLYDDEIYTGALIHDEGVCSVFEKHARRVNEILKEHGVKRVITIDPHTTDMLRSVYPKILDDFQVEVKNYLEILAEMNIEPENKLDDRVVIHDSCVFSRYENIIEEPRLLLEKSGIRIIEPENSGKMTYCCGGPIESLFPGKTHAIAKKRIDQLAEKSGNVVTMCPICLINLRQAAEGKDVSVKDISQYLVEAHCGDQHS